MRRIEVDKGGQQMTLTTLILIVLGIAVLVFLIFGFSTGWNNLFDRVTQFGGSSNVDTIKQACALACSTGSESAYCVENRTVKYGDGSDSEQKTCEELVEDTRVSVEACPSITC